MVLWLDTTRRPATGAKAGNAEPSSVISGVSSPLRSPLMLVCPPHNAGSGSGSASADIIKVDHDGASTQAGGKSDSIRAIGVVGGNDRLAQRDEVISPGQVADGPRATGA